MTKLWKRLLRPWARRAFCLSLGIALFGVVLTGCVGIGPDYLLATDYRQAELLFEQGFIPLAMEKAESIGKQDPDYKRGQVLLKDIHVLAMTLSREHMEIAEAYEKAGILRKAMREYRTALLYNPSNNWGRKKLALLGRISAGDKPGAPLPGLAEMKKEIKKAKKKEIGPETKAARHYAKAKFYFISGKYNRAIKHFNAALKDMPDYKDADVFLRLARLERQNFIDFHIKQGVTLFQREELEKAVKEWDSVLAVDPKNTEAADYKKRAEAIEKKVKKIKDNQSEKIEPVKAGKKKKP